MLLMFSPIFVADAKIICSYTFVASFAKKNEAPKSKI